MTAAFGPFAIDSETRQLRRGQADLHLSPKAFDLLCLLLEHRPKVLEKPDLHAQMWPDTHVVDGSLNVLITEIRRALGDDPSDARFIRTVHRRRLCLLRRNDSRCPSGPARDAPMLADGEKRRPTAFVEGENMRRPRSGMPRLAEHDQRVPPPRADRRRQPERTDFTRGPGQQERHAPRGHARGEPRDVVRGEHARLWIGRADASRLERRPRVGDEADYAQATLSPVVAARGPRLGAIYSPRRSAVPFVGVGLQTRPIHHRRVHWSNGQNHAWTR